MKAAERTPQQLLHSGDQYVIPVFQRYYTWNKGNWEQLWDDLSDLLEPGEEERRHFLGSIVCVPERHQPGSVPAYQVIDGQQRMTTLSILLCAIRDAASKSETQDLAAEIDEIYLINKFKKGRERFKLFPRLRDRALYLDLVRESKVGVDGQIPAAYKYFLKRLPTGEESLRRVFEAVTERIDLVSITLDDENPYKIFKSLNSTGVDLEQGDLIRNHVFMALSLDQQDQFDEERWRPLERHFEVEQKLDGRMFAGFFRDVLLREGKYVPAHATYEFFEKANPLSELNPFELVPQLAGLADHYGAVTGRKPHCIAEVETALGAVRSLNVTTAYPLLLRLLSAHGEGRLSEDALVRCLRMISSFVLRRYVCTDTSRTYARWFCAACRELGDAPEANLERFLVAKGWPDDVRFKQAFIKMDLYQSQYGRAVLDTLELSLQRDSERVALEKCTIEHVMPQTIGDDVNGTAWMKSLGDEWREDHASWLHTPGNLTLVGHDYNSSMRNRPFCEKKPVLAGSKVYLNRYFGNETLTSWTAESIRSRGASLADAAAALWPVHLAEAVDSAA